MIQIKTTTTETGTIKDLLERVHILIKEYPEDPRFMGLKNIYEEALMEGIINEDDNMQYANEKIASHVTEKEVRDAE